MDTSHDSIILNFTKVNGVEEFLNFHWLHLSLPEIKGGKTGYCPNAQKHNKIRMGSGGEFSGIQGKM